MHWYRSGLIGLLMVAGMLIGSPAPPVEADSVAATSTYFIARRDTRRCPSPLCGGFWVRRVNKLTTTCADGVTRAECYVPKINTKPVSTEEEHDTPYIADRVASGAAIVRGTLKPKDYPVHGNLGVLRVTEVWDSATGELPRGTVYRVRDSGIRCIGTPCPIFHTTILNTTTSRNVTDLILASVTNVSNEAIDDAFEDILTEHILVAGDITSAPGTVKLTATQFYLTVRLWQDYHSTP